MDKVDRRIVHPNVRPFHFQIKTYYLSMDAKYPTDNPSQTENNVNTAIKNLEQWNFTKYLQTLFSSSK